MVLIAISFALTFCTGIARSDQYPVQLGSAGDFSILAASLISSVPTSAIIGNVGLSPSAGSQITGLTAVEVDGFIYTVDETGPAGSRQASEMLTAAKGDLTVAYNDAAERTPTPTGDFLNPGEGNIGGMTLEAGLYKFTGTASITDSNLTLAGAESDIWIFQISSNLVVGSGVQVILTGGAQAGNIFWQVGTSATMGTGSVMKGIILADQSISLASGSEIEGRLLASIGAVTLDASNITAPQIINVVSEIGSTPPKEFMLGGNYPNPFNSSTKIGFDVPHESRIEIAVFDLVGRKVATLVQRELDAGHYSTVWNAYDFVSGVYILRMKTNGYNAAHKISLIR